MERYGIHKPSQDKDIVFNCRAGVRSLVAIESANKLGYSRYLNLSKFLASCASPMLEYNNEYLH